MAMDPDDMSRLNTKTLDRRGSELSLEEGNGVEAFSLLRTLLILEDELKRADPLIQLS